VAGVKGNKMKGTMILITMLFGNVILNCQDIEDTIQVGESPECANSQNPINHSEHGEKHQGHRGSHEELQRKGIIPIYMGNMIEGQGKWIFIVSRVF